MRKKAKKIRLANYYNVKSKCQAQKANFDESFENSKRAILEAKKKFASVSKAILTGNVTRFYAQNLALAKKWQESLEQNQQALIQFVPDFYNTDVFSLPSPDSIPGIHSDLLSVLEEKARIFFILYQEKSEIKYLEASWDHSQLFLHLLQNFRNQQQNLESKMYISTSAKPLAELAIETALELASVKADDSYLEKAFYIAERSKAVTLYSSLNTQQARYTASLPDSLLDREMVLDSKISFYKKQIHAEHNKTDGQDSVKINQWERQLFQLIFEKDELERTLESEYSDYYAHKYTLPKMSVHELQDLISNDNALFVEYFVGEKNTYRFSISKHELKVDAISDVSQVKMNLDELLFQLYQADPEQWDKQRFAHVSGDLFTHLIPDDYRDYGKLIIVPDGRLGFLPFEILLTSHLPNSHYLAFPYLIRELPISYAYSAQLLYKDPLNRPENIKTKQNWLGFAPEFEGPKALNFNKQEVDAIQTLFKGTSYTKQEASKETYIDQSPDYQILHLATHASADVEQAQFSFLEFTEVDTQKNSILYAHEVMNQKLNADMVVLSACESGYGPLVEGEGIMSLARAFRYAGSPSIVMSLWKAESSVTAKIMERFYVHLQSGFSKDEALQEAKLDYLNTPAMGRTHPRYWANFVIIGDAKPLISSFNWMYMWAACLGAGLLIGLGYRRFKFS